MNFEEYKQQFDKNFSQVKPEDFILQMQQLGYKFTDIMKTYTFYRNQDNKWFVDLPEFLEKFPGHEGELQMVFGADTMLEIIGQGQDTVKVDISLQQFENSTELTKMHDTPEVGGAMYVMNNYQGNVYNLEMWLCGVTEFVFGHLPEKIYLTQHA